MFVDFSWVHDEVPFQIHDEEGPRTLFVNVLFMVPHHDETFFWVKV